MILAAGSGTRLRPLTNHVPKCMIPIGGKPLLEHTIMWLAASGIDDIVMNLSYMPQAVEAYFGDGRRWGVRIVYSLEEQALGTAGGVRNVAGHFGQTFLVWYGDNLSTVNIDRLCEAHRAKSGLATIALHYREDVSQSGIVGVDGDGRIVRLIEKPRPDQVFSHWVNAGIYVLEPEVLDAIPAGEGADFARDVFPGLLRGGVKLYGYCLGEAERLWWIDRPDDLARVQDEWEASR